MELQHKINISFRRFKIWLSKKLITGTWFLKKHISILAFNIVDRVCLWNPVFYDAKVKQLYIKVRTKEAIQFKEKIVSLGKGQEQVKMLLIDMPDRTVKIKLEKIQFPQIYK